MKLKAILLIIFISALAASENEEGSDSEATH